MIHHDGDEAEIVCDGCGNWLRIRSNAVVKFITDTGWLVDEVSVSCKQCSRSKR